MADEKKNIFSIVIPVYNVEKYIQECFESIIPQALEVEEGCEIIVIDDGSTDNSGIICDKYEKKFPELLKVYHRSNHGLLLTRRFGYQHTTGDYIINCDSDDMLEPDALQLLRDAIKKYNKPDVILFNICGYKDRIKEKGFDNIFSDKESCRIKKEDVLKQYLSGYSIVSVCEGICRRNCIDIYKDYTNYSKFNYGEDSLQKLEQLDRGNTFVYINKSLYDYRISSGMTARFNADAFDSFRKVFDEILKRKSTWKFDHKNEYFALSALFAIGRLLTQSRYNKWDKKSDHKKYLMIIRNDNLFKESIPYISVVKKKMQRDHVILLKMLSFGWYEAIITLLDIKNLLEKIGNRK